MVKQAHESGSPGAHAWCRPVLKEQSTRQDFVGVAGVVRCTDVGVAGVVRCKDGADVDIGDWRTHFTQRNKMYHRGLTEALA